MAADETSNLSGSGERTGWLKAVDRISTVCGWISAAMILISVLIICQMIFVRFVLNLSTIWQTEAVTFLMVAATLIGLPYVQKLRGHVNVDLIPLMMRPSARRALALFTLSVTIIIAALMMVYGFEFWHTAWSRNWKSDTVWGVRLWIPYLAMPIGFGLLLLQLIADLAAVVTGIDKPFGISRESR